MKKTSLYLTIVAIHIAIPCFLIAQAGCSSSSEENQTPPEAASSVEEVTTISTEDKNVSEPSDNKPAEGSPTLRAEPTKPTWNMAPVVEPQSEPSQKEEDFIAPKKPAAKKTADIKKQEGESYYIVKKGDSISKIAAEHGIPMKVLLEKNSIKNPNSIRIGQKLKLPSGAKVSGSHAEAAEPSPTQSGEDLSVYIVQRGDSLSLISMRTGTTVKQLMKINNLKNANIRIGQKLYVKKAEIVENANAPKAKESASSDEIKHKVKAGEFLGMIAAKYSVTVADIKARNNIKDPRKIRAGQTLIIPVKGKPKTQAQEAPKPKAPAATATVTVSKPEAKAPAATATVTAPKAETAAPIILPEAPKTQTVPVQPDAQKAQENVQVIEL